MERKVYVRIIIAIISIVIGSAIKVTNPASSLQYPLFAIGLFFIATAIILIIANSRRK